MRTRLTSIALAAVAILALTSGGPASAATVGGITTLFNTPTNNIVIQMATVDLINAAPKGSYVRMAMYHLTMASVGDALSTAYARGVHIQMVLDPSAGVSPVVQKLRALLGSDPARTDFAVFFAPKGAIMHNKFVLFSNPMMVVDSTANFTNTRTWNGAVIVRDHPAYYKSYTTRFSLLAHAKVGTFTTALDNDVKSYLFPQPETSDAWVGILRSVKPQGAHIDIAMFNFTDQKLADQLNSMAAHGTRIRVAYTNLVAKLSAKISKRSYSPTAQVFVHSKELILHGSYSGTGGPYQVWLGSTNFTLAGIHHNAENTTRVSGQAIWTKFDTNFGQIFTYKASPYAA